MFHLITFNVTHMCFNVSANCVPSGCLLKKSKQELLVFTSSRTIHHFSLCVAMLEYLVLWLLCFPARFIFSLCSFPAWNTSLKDSTVFRKCQDWWENFCGYLVWTQWEHIQKCSCCTWAQTHDPSALWLLMPVRQGKQNSFVTLNQQSTTLIEPIKLIPYFVFLHRLVFRGLTSVMNSFMLARCWTHLQLWLPPQSKRV